MLKGSSGSETNLNSSCVQCNLYSSLLNVPIAGEISYALDVPIIVKNKGVALFFNIFFLNSATFEDDKNQPETVQLWRGKASGSPSRKFTNMYLTVLMIPRDIRQQHIIGSLNNR